MRPDAPSIRFAGAELGHARHICAFFNSQDERYRVLLPFIKEGFDRGDRAVHIVSPSEHPAHIARLVGVGIDIDGAAQSGRFELLADVDAYLRDSHFDQERMLQVFRDMAGRANEWGRISRFVCHMDWVAHEGRSHIDDLIEFEARVNDIWDQHDDAVVCVYDLAAFSGETIIDVMRTHPMIVVGGVLQENPFYVPPGEFLDELRARRAAGGPGTG